MDWMTEQARNNVMFNPRSAPRAFDQQRAHDELIANIKRVTSALEYIGSQLAIRNKEKSCN